MSKCVSLILCLVVLCFVLCLGQAAYADEPQDGDKLFSSPAELDRPDALFWKVAHRLNSHRTLRGSFRQSKSVKALARPLESSGLFLFHADHGLIWDARRPFRVATVVSPKGIWQYRDEERVEVVPQDKQAAVAGFSSAFLSLFSADVATLKARFKVFFTGTDEDWRVGLVPSERMLSRALSNVVISGGENVRRLEIAEANGDFTRIEFSDLTTEPAELSASELKKFEAP